MTSDDLKLYSLIVKGGSGCFFQPMTKEYTYILTAKHLFFLETENDRGEKKSIEMNDGDEIEIFRQLKVSNGWKEVEIPFILNKGINYFPHENADVAILKIPFIPGYNSTSIISQFVELNDFELCGSPNSIRGNAEGERYTTYSVERFMATGNFCKGAQIFGTLQQQDIEGMSGGAIMKILGDSISIIGIQSKMASKAINQAGQIGFVQIEYFNEITSYPKNADELTPLLPVFMSNFDFLKDEILKLEGCIDNNFIIAIRNKLKLEVDEVNLKPIDIIDLPFKNQLLIENEKISINDNKELWISWLEYLIVLHIVKQKVINKIELTEIFNEIRLVHSDRDVDWYRFMSDIFRTDLKGLNENGVLIVSSKIKPSVLSIEGEDLITNIANANPVAEFKTDNADIHPLQQFRFLHIKTFETACIENNETELKEYIGLNIHKLKGKLKEIFDEVLQS